MIFDPLQQKILAQPKQSIFQNYFKSSNLLSIFRFLGFKVYFLNNLFLSLKKLNKPTAMENNFTYLRKYLLISFLFFSSNVLQSQNYIEIVTDTSSFQYNDNGQWVNAQLGTPQPDQIISVNNQIGVADSNMIWSGTSSSATLRRLFNLDSTVCIDSARFWIQGDDFVSDLSLNGVTIGNTTFGWTNFQTALVPVNLFVPGQNILTISGNNATGARRFLAMKVRIYLCNCSNPTANEIVTDITNWQYENNGQWQNAVLGTPQPGQITSVQNQIGLDAQNMIWGGNNASTTLKNEFSIVDSACIDSARFWIQGDDYVSDLSLNGVTIGSTPFGWTNYTTGLVPLNLINSGQNTLIISGDNSTLARKFVAMKMVIYTCGCSITTTISENLISSNFDSNYKIYPNPTSSHLVFETPNSFSNYNLDIFSIESNLIKHFECLSSNSLDITDLASGTYFISLNDGKEKVIKRFVKID